MLITVLFKGGIKEYTYEAPEGTRIGLYALNDDLVIVAGYKLDKPTFEIKKFEGVYVQDELYNRHFGALKNALAILDWKSVEVHASRLKWLKEGHLKKYANCADFNFIADYVDLLG